jgi:hypothetical protein
MKFLDPDHPFFARPWRRWATVLIPALWAAVELWGGSPGWALIFGAAAGYALWALILAPRRS